MPLSSSIEKFINNIEVENIYPKSMYEAFLTTQLRILRDSFLNNCKTMDLLQDFLTFFDNILNRFENRQCSTKILDNEISFYIRIVEQNHIFLQLIYEEIILNYWNIRHDDKFLKYFTYFCLKSNSTIKINLIHNIENRSQKTL